MKNNLRRGLGLHIQKSYIEGIYSDNSQNRKLGRVGMSYGHRLNLSGFEEEKDDEGVLTTNPKIVLKRAKFFLSERSFQFLKDIMEGENFEEGDVYEYKGKIYFDKRVEVSPERDKDIVNLGIRERDPSQKENSYYKFIRETWSPQQLEKIWLNTFEKEEVWGKSKNYSMLARLQKKNEFQKFLLEEGKRSLWWKRYDEGKVSGDSDYSIISDNEAEKYIRVHGRKTEKDQLKHYSLYVPLINSLKKYGIDIENIDKEEIDNFNRKFKEYIINCPRNEFYQVVKGCAEDSFYMEKLIKLRFAFKYNKMIAGEGWKDIKDENEKVDIVKRDEVFELCKQIEYSIDDVLGEDKDLFINNPNIDFIRFDKDTKWGGASYSEPNKVITITDEYFKSVKENKRNNERANTLSREKFMVEGFVHEIGHSLDITSDIYDSEPYKDFAKHLGFDKNRHYTIFANAIKQDADLFEGEDYYLSIERDRKEELLDKFGELYKNVFGAEIKDENLGDIFISDYSSKSASEGFAEYFSFYMGNKKLIDKEIEEYNKNSKKYLANADIKNWYKYSVYGKKWKFLFDVVSSEYRDQESKKVLRDYYEAIVSHNIEMLEDVQKIVKMAKKNMKQKE